MFKNKIQFFFKKVPWFEILPRLTVYFINKKCTTLEIALFFWTCYIDIKPPYNKEDDFKNFDCFDQDIEYF